MGKDLIKIYEHIEELNSRIDTLTQQVRVLSLPSSNCNTLQSPKLNQSIIKKSVTKLFTKIKQFIIFIITI